MKTLLILFALVCCLFGAQEMAPVPPPPTLISFNAVPLFDAGKKLISFTVITTWQTMEPQPSGRTEPMLRVVQFDLVAQKNQRITVNGQTFDYGDVPNDLLAVALLEFYKSFPPPLPVDRKALRSRVISK